MADNSTPDPPKAPIPVVATSFAYPLQILPIALRSRVPVKIVAIGSSSTAGKDPVIPYPYRLERFLRATYDNKFPPDEHRIINVLNRGKGGEEAPKERDRLKTDVLDEQPAMVIWQIGTNGAWKGTPSVREIEMALNEGLAMLPKDKMDIVLMDPQFVPTLVAPGPVRQRTIEIVDVIERAAAYAKVNLFRRFELMRGWYEIEQVSFDTMLDPQDRDRVHQSDWSTDRVAGELARVIAEAVEATSKTSPPTAPPTLAVPPPTS